MKKARNTKLLIEFNVPCGVEFSDLRDFIIDALESMGGCRHPSDPLFHSLDNVKVSKPVVPWRDPARAKKAKINLVGDSA